MQKGVKHTPKEYRIAFPRTEYFGNRFRHPIYVQEYCQPIYEYDDYTELQASIQLCNKVFDRYLHLYSDWCIYAIQYYSEDFVNELYEILINLSIDDICSPMNVGISLIDSRPVILDWGGGIFK